MIRIGQRLGRSRLESYVKAFGFGEPTGVELTAESRGILRPSERWGPVTSATITFGQEVSVTPLQMVAAANVIATSGYLMRPRLVLGFGGSDGALRITPVGTSFDGDVVFALCQPDGPPGTLMSLEINAAAALEDAIERAVRLAVGRDGIPGLADETR